MSKKGGNNPAIEALKNAVPRASWTEDSDIIAPSLHERRDRYFGHTPLMLSPASTKETAQMVQICARHGQNITLQGGNTGLVGGQIPQGEVLLSTRRLNQIRNVSPINDCLTAEAGVTLSAVQDAALKAGRYFPLTLASQGSCTVGGNLATNAGGVHVIKYGMARALCFGVEAVLPNGEIYNGMTSLRKDNTGYDLSGLFIGAEGTLGIITAASLKLFPAPAHTVRVFAAVPDPDKALALLELCQSSDLAMFEIMCQRALEFVTQYIPGQQTPFSDRSPFYVLIDWETDNEAAGRARAQERLSGAMKAGLITDAVIAQNQRQSAQLLALRENMSAAQKHAGASVKMDVSLPINQIPEFLEKAEKAVKKIVSHCRPIPFGHLGDGNLHYNISQPEEMEAAAFLAHWQALSEAVFDIVDNMGGSISAEHGIGVMKNTDLARRADPAKLALMRQIKTALDPQNIMNPRVLL